jgi:hypothetical protein
MKATLDFNIHSVTVAGTCLQDESDAKSRVKDVFEPNAQIAP